MNSVAIIFLALNAIGLLTFPRRWAPLPLLVGTCYMTLGQVVEIGPFNFTFLRIIILVGLARVSLRRERLAGGMNSLDRLIIVWAVWVLISSFFHNDPNAALIFRLGMAYNVCGIYFLFRVFCQSINDVVLICRFVAILLFPVAVEMFYEKLSFPNLFSAFGGVPEMAVFREDKIRSFGPFLHPILAGTVGAASLPLMIGIWRFYQREAIIGIVACLGMIFTSSSSGPIMSAMAAFVALFMWRYRHKMKLVRWLAALGYIGLDMVMQAPAYYIIGRINIVSGSTGYHRAALIESAIKNIDDWWLYGTDYTRHWLPTGVEWSEDHTDITNYYLGMGVVGGLPLMLLYIAILAKGFSYVGMILHRSPSFSPYSPFIIWCLGSALFVHAVTSISVSYFDQSFVFIYMTLALIASTMSSTSIEKQSKKSALS